MALMRTIIILSLVLTLSSCSTVAGLALKAVSSHTPSVSASAQIGKTNTKQNVLSQTSVSGSQTNNKTIVNNVPWWAMTPMGYIITFLVGMYAWLHLPRGSEMWSMLRKKKNG